MAPHELLRDHVVNDGMLNDDILNDDALHGGTLTSSTLAIGARSAPLPGVGAERWWGHHDCGGVAPPPTPELEPAGSFSPGPACPTPLLNWDPIFATPPNDGGGGPKKHILGGRPTTI